MTTDNRILQTQSRRKGTCVSLLVAVVILCALMPIKASACMVPVFRYALERWPASPYRLAVLHKGELSPQEKAELESLRPPGVYSLAIETYDVDGKLPDGIVKDHWQGKQPSEGFPYGLFFSPADMRTAKPLLWQGRLDGRGIAALKKLIYSPLMRRFCRSLATGDSAVWIILRGKDEKANRRARLLLDDALKQMQDEMRLPHERDPLDTTYTQPLAPGVQFQLRFSVVETDLAAPENALLRQIVAALNQDLVQQAEPMVMPVFGRGRALALLMGEDISKNVFWEISSFLVGPCSCRVKELNPGFDLLAPFPWDEVLYGGIGVERALDTLPGTDTGDL